MMGVIQVDRNFNVTKIKLCISGFFCFLLNIQVRIIKSSIVLHYPQMLDDFDLLFMVTKVKLCNSVMEQFLNKYLSQSHQIWHRPSLREEDGRVRMWVMFDLLFTWSQIVYFPYYVNIFATNNELGSLKMVYTSLPQVVGWTKRQVTLT